VLRSSLIALVRVVGFVLLGVVAGFIVFVMLHAALHTWIPGVAAPTREGRQNNPTNPPLAAAADEALTVAIPNHVTLIVHGVSDDGKGWSRRFKDALDAGDPTDGLPDVYLFRWTQPDGRAPDFTQARNRVAGLEDRFPDQPATEAVYQVAVAERMHDFLVGARALYAEYGIDGRIDVVAHSQGTLITLEALDQGGEADNVVFLGSPLLYTGDRQDDVIAALPHIRGVLFNYFTPSDKAMRAMGGGIIFEPRGWPQTDLPPNKVVQVRVNVAGHTGYYTEDAIRANYLDKLGAQGAPGCRLSPAKAVEFTEKWNKLTAAAGLIDPE